MNLTERHFTLHMGQLILGGLLIIGGLGVLTTLGWPWLWLLPAALATLWIVVFVVDVIEDRFRIVTPEHIARGVPASCTRCGEDWDVVIKTASYKMRCPICGHRETGRLDA